MPPTFDCKARAAAWEYGKYLLPDRGDFRTLFEALQLQVSCPAAAHYLLS